MKNRNVYPCRFIFIEVMSLELPWKQSEPQILYMYLYASMPLPWQGMQSNLSFVNVVLFLPSLTGTELPSLFLKPVEHVDRQFYQDTQAYNFVDCIWYQNTRSQSSACLLEPNVMQWFLWHSVPALPPSWGCLHNLLPDRISLFSCWKHSQLK